MEFSLDDCRSHLLSLPQVTESSPFGPETLVYKVAGKMFATLGFREQQGRMNLKCNPDWALELREQYEAVIPGYHMNKKHWNTLSLDHSLPPALITELINHSYRLVVQGLPVKVRKQIEPST